MIRSSRVQGKTDGGHDTFTSLDSGKFRPRIKTSKSHQLLQTGFPDKNPLPYWAFGNYKSEGKDVVEVH